MQEAFVVECKHEAEQAGDIGIFAKAHHAPYHGRREHGNLAVGDQIVEGDLNDGFVCLLHGVPQPLADRRQSAGVEQVSISRRGAGVHMFEQIAFMIGDKRTYFNAKSGAEIDDQLLQLLDRTDLAEQPRIAFAQVFHVRPVDQADGPAPPTVSRGRQIGKGLQMRDFGHGGTLGGQWGERAAERRKHDAPGHTATLEGLMHLWHRDAVSNAREIVGLDAQVVSVAAGEALVTQKYRPVAERFARRPAIAAMSAGCSGDEKRRYR